MPARPTTLVAFGVLSFTYFATIGLFNPYAPLWFKELGYSTLAIGALASLQNWTRVVAPYAWAWLGDHGGRRTELLRLSAWLSLLASLGLLYFEQYAAVAVVTALLFLSNGGIVPLSEAALSQQLASTPQGLDAGRYGRVRVWGSAGFIAAVVSCGFVLQSFGVRLFPGLVVATLVLMLLATLRLPVAHAERPRGASSPAVWSVLRQPRIVWFFASVFSTVLAHSSLYVFLSLYLDGLGYGKAAVGALWGIGVAAEIAFFWFQGHWFHRLSAHQWLQVAAGVAVLRFAATAAFGQHAAVLVAAQALHAVTFAAHHAACIMLLHRYFAGPLRGRGQALYTTLGYGLSGVVGGLGGGWLCSHFGFAAVFWAASLAAALGVWCARRSARLETLEVL